METIKSSACKYWKIGLIFLTFLMLCQLLYMSEVKTKKFLSFRFSNKNQHYDSPVEEEENMVNYTMLVQINGTIVNKTVLVEKPLCPEKPPGLVGILATYTESPTFEQLEAKYSWLKPGGRSKPKTCISRSKVAVIVPYRDRDAQLRTFLHNLHPFLKRQLLDYGIFIIEQTGTSIFNRAMLMNIGFVEASKLYSYDCFVFHDVDLIPEHDHNLYSCGKNPRHLSASIDKYQYKLPYTQIFGGVSQIPKNVFQSINGFSNQYFGWGGEDDDMWNRLHAGKFRVERYAIAVARYKMIKHKHEKLNRINPQRHKLLREGPKRYKTDGLNSLKYKLIKLEKKILYTHIQVDINEKDIIKKR